MNALVLALAEAPPDELVTPGLPGFVVFFALAVATIGLARSFSRQMRRIDHRARLAAEEEDEVDVDDDPAGLPPLRSSGKIEGGAPPSTPR